MWRPPQPPARRSGGTRRTSTTIGGAPAAFALFYPTYSTILGRPGIHREDLYVAPEHRGAGIGHALRFYRRLHACGLDEIEILRLDGGHLRDLASTVSPPAEPDTWSAS